MNPGEPLSSPALLAHFRALYSAAADAGEFTLDARAQRLWLDYPFPGNVRELRNVVIRLVTKFRNRTVGVEDLAPELDSGATLLSVDEFEIEDLAETARRELGGRGAFNLDDRLAAWERAYVAAAMKLAGGNVSQAARMLGLNRTTLYSRMAVLERGG